MKEKQLKIIEKEKLSKEQRKQLEEYFKEVGLKGVIIVKKVQ